MTLDDHFQKLSEKIDKEMTEKLGTPDWHIALWFESWRPMFEQKTFPENMGETITPIKKP